MCRSSSVRLPILKKMLLRANSFLKLQSRYQKHRIFPPDVTELTAFMSSTRCTSGWRDGTKLPTFMSLSLCTGRCLNGTVLPLSLRSSNCSSRCKDRTESSTFPLYYRSVWMERSCPLSWALLFLLACVWMERCCHFQWSLLIVLVDAEMELSRLPYVRVHISVWMERSCLLFCPSLCTVRCLEGTA